MVDIRKDFGDSFNLLMHHKKIIIPIFFSILTPLILIFLFLHLSGLNPLLKSLATTIVEFDGQKQDYLLDKENIGKENYNSELFNYFLKDSESSTYSKELDEFLIQSGYDWGNYIQLLNTKNIIMLVIFMLISIIVSFYFSCMSYAIIALVLKKKEIDANNLIRVTNKFLLKFLSLRIIMGFIIIAPIIIVLGIVISLFFLNLIIGFLSLFIFTLLLLVYLILIGLRLFFAAPSMFIKEQGATTSIEHSWQITNGHLKQVFIIFFILWGISLFINTFVGQPLYGTFSSFLFEESWIRSSINFILVVLFLILEAFVFTFHHIFLFYTYIDFKSLRKIVK